MVHLNVRTESVEKMKDAFFTEFDLVILLDQSYEVNFEYYYFIHVGCV
jgi:hypothetical protein